MSNQQTIDVRRGHTSASNADADARCPGRHLAQVGIADEPRGEWAETGTRIHAALAGGHDPTPLQKLSLEERETFDACREIEKALVTQFFGDGNGKSPQNIVVKRHERYWLKFVKDGKPYEHSGEADVVFRSGTKALILDYKVLSGDVPDSPRNLQLRDLACLVYGNVPLLDGIGTAIVQPLVTHKPEVCLYTKPDLDRSSLEMVERVVASNTAGSPLTPGEVQCKYCKARKVCKPHAQWVGAVIPAVSTAEPLVQAGVLSMPMTMWTPEQRAVAAELVGLAEKKLDEIWQFLKAGMEADPAFIPGWKLKPGNIRESVTNVQELFDRFTSLGGTLPQFFPCITVQKGELKKAVNEVTAAKGKALDAAMKTIMDGITESKQNAPSLVKEDA